MIIINFHIYIYSSLTETAQPQIFHSVHYSGEDLILKFGANEAWKKVFGPIFIYLNTLTTKGDNPISLWENAKKQVYLLKLH
jgi:hypothetical protein